jgi:hypothetical protein
MIFPPTPVWTGGQRVHFTASSRGRAIIFSVDFTALERFGERVTIDNALTVFGRNREVIQRVAKQQHAAGVFILDAAAFDRAERP